MKFLSTLGVALTILAMSFETQAAYITKIDLLPDSTGARPYGFTRDGQTVVGYGYGGAGYFTWDSVNGAVSVDRSVRNEARFDDGISANGTKADNNSRDGAYLEAGNGDITPIGKLPGGSLAYSYAISEDGTVAVGSSKFTDGDQSGWQAWRWTAETGIQGLGNLDGGRNRSYALGVNGDGSVIVGDAENANGDTVATLWAGDKGIQVLSDVLTEKGVDLSAWLNLESAVAVSTDGRYILGYGDDLAGNRQAFYVDMAPVPVPAAAWLFGSALVTLVSLRKKKSAH